jgi:hypothetical protein
MDDLKRAFKTLTNKDAPYTLAFQYYEGNQPLVYSTERLREAFDNISARFNQNWCAVVVDSVLDRLTLKGFDAPVKADNAALDSVWQRLHLELDAYDAHQAALITNEAYIIIQKDEDKTQAWFNDPRMCHVFYKADNPKEKLFAAKWWVGDDGHWRMNLYYPDRTEHYITRTAKQPAQARAFIPDPDGEEEPNEYGVIPVFHLRTNRRGRGSELLNITTLQDAVNKLLADMMVAAEFGAWMQRWIITDGDINSIKNAPYENWVLPAGDGQGQGTQVGQFQATDLGNFLEAIDKIANSIAIITRTPKHYFYSVGAGVSGEALLAMEAPLVKKVKNRQENYSVVWQEIAAFLLRLETGREIPPEDITPVWEPAASTQPFTEAQARKLSIEAGIPLITQLKREGWGEDEIFQLQADIEADQARKTVMAKLLLEQARIKQEQSNPPEDNQNQGD